MSDEREVVRAWVARWPHGSIAIYRELPTLRRCPRGDYWEGGQALFLEDDDFPDILPGECWPVEIRRIAE